MCIWLDFVYTKSANATSRDLNMVIELASVLGDMKYFKYFYEPLHISYFLYRRRIIIKLLFIFCRMQSRICFRDFFFESRPLNVKNVYRFIILSYSTEAEIKKMLIITRHCLDKALHQNFTIIHNIVCKQCLITYISVNALEELEK